MPLTPKIMSCNSVSHPIFRIQTWSYMTELSDKLIILMSRAKYFRMTFMSAGVSMLTKCLWHKSWLQVCSRILTGGSCPTLASCCPSDTDNSRDKIVIPTSSLSTVPWILKTGSPRTTQNDGTDPIAHLMIQWVTFLFGIVRSINGAV